MSSFLLRGPAWTLSCGSPLRVGPHLHISAIKGLQPHLGYFLTANYQTQEAVCTPKFVVSWSEERVAHGPLSCTCVWGEGAPSPCRAWLRSRSCCPKAPVEYGSFNAQLPGKVRAARRGILLSLEKEQSPATVTVWVPLVDATPGTAHFIQGRRGDIILPEVIKTLNILTERKTPCTKLMIADALAVPKNTTEREAVCRAATALRQFYLHHKVSWCFKEHGELGDLRLLRGLDRNLCSMAKLSNCPGKEARQTTLEDFLDRLKTAMQEKYSKRQS